MVPRNVGVGAGTSARDSPHGGSVRFPKKKVHNLIFPAMLVGRSWPAAAAAIRSAVVQEEETSEIEK